MKSIIVWKKVKLEFYSTCSTNNNFNNFEGAKSFFGAPWPRGLKTQMPSRVAQSVLSKTVVSNLVTIHHMWRQWL